MRPPLSAPRVLVALAIAGLISCTSDSVSSPERDLMPLMNAVAAGVLTVDNDLADCPRADFTTIQEAVNAAEPGTTILVCAGVYHEWVVITTNELRLLAKGQPGEVVLDGQNVAGTNCTPTSPLAFQCAGFELRNAHNSLIEGFLVRRYWETGIWLRLGSSGNTIRKNVTTETPHHDGIQLQNSPQNVIEHNTSFANFAPANNACGINVQGAGSVGNIVRQNKTFANDFGIQVSAGGATNNRVFDNDIHDNRRFGIRNVAGTNGTEIANNRVLDNTGPGIAVLAGTGLTVARNKAFNNAPDLQDLVVVGNTYENNHCRTSVPDGLCTHTEGASSK